MTELTSTSSEWARIARNAGTVACLAVAALTAVSVITLAGAPPRPGVPQQLYDAVVIALAVLGVVLPLLCASIAPIRRGLGRSAASTGLVAAALVLALFANAVALDSRVALFPQSATSLFAAVIALAGAVFALVSLQRSGGRRDHSHF